LLLICITVVLSSLGCKTNKIDDLCSAMSSTPLFLRVKNAKKNLFNLSVLQLIALVLTTKVNQKNTKN